MLSPYNNPEVEIKGRTPSAPKLYSPQVVRKIINYILRGESIHQICKKRGMPSRITFSKWLTKYPEFLKAYWQAKMAQAIVAVDEIDKIVEEANADSQGDLTKVKMQVATKQWMAEKLLPKVYGNRVQGVSDIDREDDYRRMEEVMQKIISQKKGIIDVNPD